MIAVRGQRGVRRSAFASMLLIPGLVLVLVLSAGAPAQQVADEEVGELEIDPISFRGPNPTERFKDINIQQNLGAKVPLDLTFRNERDEEVRLGDLFGDKPVVLSLVYYECPMLCNLVLTGMVNGFDGQPEDFQLGEDYTAISVSINPEETGALASEKKANYLDTIHIDGAADGWHYLTGDEEAIETLARAVGFRYYYDEPTGQYAHGSGIMIVTPAGTVSSYYLGIEYLPGNLRTALEVAGANSIGEYLKQPSLLCFAYDPTSGSYGLVIMSALRLGGIATVLLIVAFWFVHYLRSRRSGRSGTNGKASHTPSPAGTA